MNMGGNSSPLLGRIKHLEEVFDMTAACNMLADGNHILAIPVVKDGQVGLVIGITGDLHNTQSSTIHADEHDSKERAPGVDQCGSR